MSNQKFSNNSVDKFFLPSLFIWEFSRAGGRAERLLSSRELARAKHPGTKGKLPLAWGDPSQPQGQVLGLLPHRETLICRDAGTKLLSPSMPHSSLAVGI